MYALALEHVRGLAIPEGISVEILPLRAESGMAQAYNKAMRITDAKYKIYVHHFGLTQRHILVLCVLTQSHVFCLHSICYIDAVIRLCLDL